MKKYKSDKRPIISQEQRASILAALNCVDYVCIFYEPQVNSFLEDIKPDIHVKSKSGYTGVEKDALEKAGAKLYLVEDFEGFSTSKIIEKILEVYGRNNRS